MSLDRRYSWSERPVAAARAASSSRVSSGTSRIVIDVVIAAPPARHWNRFILEVADLDGLVAGRRRDGVRFCNDIVTGVGGKQIMAEDPSGNPVEQFGPVLREARLSES
jgi:hypothetical protein